MTGRDSLNQRSRPLRHIIALLRNSADGIALAAAAVGGLVAGGLLRGDLSPVENTTLLSAQAAFWLAGLAFLRWLRPWEHLSFERVLSGSARSLIAAMAILLSLVVATSLGLATSSIVTSLTIAMSSLLISFTLALPAVAVSRRLWPASEPTRQMNDKGARRHEEALSIVFHELRRPLSTLVSASELALAPDITEEERSHLLQNLNRQALRLNDFLEEILEAARIQSGRLRLNLRPIDLRQLAEEGCAEFAEGHRGHDLRLILGERAMMVAADPTKLRMVLSNLIANAVSYSPQGSLVTVRVSREKDVVLLQVEDEGPGVPEPYRQQIFEQYFRIPGTSERGFGLGLYIAHRLMEALGGSIGVDGREPRGSRFTVRLPALMKGADLRVRRRTRRPHPLSDAHAQQRLHVQGDFPDQVQGSHQ